MLCSPSRAGVPHASGDLSRRCYGTLLSLNSVLFPSTISDLAFELALIRQSFLLSGLHD